MVITHILEPCHDSLIKFFMPRLSFCPGLSIEELLEDHSFTRVHRSFLVNLHEIEKYVRGDGGYLVMSDGSEILISRNKKEELLKKLLPNRE